MSSVTTQSSVPQAKQPLIYWPIVAAAAVFTLVIVVTLSVNVLSEDQPSSPPVTLAEGQPARPGMEDMPDAASALAPETQALAGAPVQVPIEYGMLASITIHPEKPAAPPTPAIEEVEDNKTPPNKGRETFGTA